MSVEFFYACQQFIRFSCTGKKVVSCWGFYIIVRKASEDQFVVVVHALLLFSFLQKKQEVEVYSLLSSIMFNKDLSMSSCIGGYKDEKCL